MASKKKSKAKPAAKSAKKSAKKSGAKKSGAKKSGSKKSGTTPASSTSTKSTWPPPGMHTLTPTCSVKNAGEAVKLYEKLFGATTLDRFDGPDGTLMHAELKIGDSIFMIGEPWSDPTPMALAIFVPDVDKVWKKALDLGCTQIFPLEMQFYGDRSGRVMDPFGNQWMISTHVEDIPLDEQHRRFKKMIAGEAWQ